jgi:hypothetical protein
MIVSTVRRAFLIAAGGLALALQAARAFASGREGEALVRPVLWIVAFVLVTFAALTFGGALLGAFRASRSGESILKGSGRGILKGLLAFAVTMGALLAVGTLAGFAWVAYSLLHVHVLNPGP